MMIMMKKWCTVILLIAIEVLIAVVLTCIQWL